MAASDPPLEILADGDACKIVAQADVCEAIEALDEKRRERLKFIMQKVSDYGPHQLPEEQFKAEGRFPIGDEKATKVLVYAFKVFQFRVYASEKHIAGKRTFVCTQVATKKNDKANRSDLKKAATNFRSVYEQK